MATNSNPTVKFFSASPERWRDLETLFGPRGACAGCWCMFWRVPRKQFDVNKGVKNKRALRNIVMKGETPPGVLAYCGDEPIGWCAIAPREVYIGLQKSRLLKPVDDLPVWSVSCLFVKRGFRRQGVSTAMLRAAIDFAARHGAKILEGYPAEPASENTADAFLWHGIPSSFRAAGFKEVVRRSASRPIMRFQIE